MSHQALRALLLGALAFGPAIAAPAAIAVEPEARYEPETLSLILSPPYGTVPVVIELQDPPRLVAEWPGTLGTAPRALLYGAGPVARFAVEAVGNRTRVTLHLRNRLDGGWKLLAAPPRAIVKLLPDQADTAYVRPLPRRTPRPAPRIPGLRVTPAPVFPMAPTPRPLPGWPIARPLPPTPIPGPTTRLPVPDPFPQSMDPATPPPVVVAPTPAPTVAPTVAPTPEPTPTPFVAGTPRPVFGSAVWAGADVPINFTETYPVGGSDLTVPFGLGGGLGWDHMFSEQVGLSLAGRTQGFQIDDEALKARGFEVRHKRDDYELGGAVRLVQPFGGGVEGMISPGVLLRASRASTTHASVVGGVAGTPVDVATSDYLSSTWLAYGGAVRSGVGWRPGGPFALVLFGEYRYLLAGNMMTPNVPAFFPLSGWRAGGEARLDFDGWGLSAGYAQGADGFTGTSAADTLSQGGGSAFLRASWLY